MIAIGVIFLVGSYHLSVHTNESAWMWAVLGAVGIVCCLIGEARG